MSTKAIQPWLFAPLPTALEIIERLAEVQVNANNQPMVNCSKNERLIVGIA